MKLEPQKARHPQLLYESKLYKILQGGVGIPHIRFVRTVSCRHLKWYLMVQSLIGLLITSREISRTRSGLDRSSLSAAVLTSCDRQCNCSVAAAAITDVTMIIEIEIEIVILTDNRIESKS